MTSCNARKRLQMTSCFLFVREQKRLALISSKFVSRKRFVGDCFTSSINDVGTTFFF
eukprot:UN23988